MLYLLLLALITDFTFKQAAGRKIRVAAGKVWYASTENGGTDDRNMTVNVKHLEGLRDDTSTTTTTTTIVEDSGPPHVGDGSPGWEKGGIYEKGRCCKKKQMGKKIYRWFIWKEDGQIKANNGAFASCPGYTLGDSNWKHVEDYYCSQNKAEVHNQYQYEEDTDWVLCCKTSAEKEPYKYFTGRQCSENDATWNCKSYDCKWVVNVDGAKHECDSGYSKTVNADWKYCKQTSEGMSAAACAGYPGECAQAWCYHYSYDKSDDCRGSCPKWENASKAHPNQVHSKVGSKKDQDGQYKRDGDGIPMIAWVGIGVFVVIAGGLGGYMFMNKGKGGGGGSSVPQDDLVAYNDSMKGKGKGGGKGYEQNGGQYYLQAPPHGVLGGQPPNSGPAFYGQQPVPGQAPPSWGVVPSPMPPNSW